MTPAPKSVWEAAFGELRDLLRRIANGHTVTATEASMRYEALRLMETPEMADRLQVVTSERDELLEKFLELVDAINIGHEPMWRLVHEIDSLRVARHTLQAKLAKLIVEIKRVNAEAATWSPQCACALMLGPAIAEARKP